MKFVSVPADFWRRWTGPWERPMLELYLLSTAAAQDHPGGAVPLRAGQVLESLNGLVKRSGRPRSTIQTWLEQLTQGQGDLVVLERTDEPTQMGTVYGVRLSGAGPRLRGTDGPPVGTSDRPLSSQKTKRLDTQSGGRSGGRIEPFLDGRTDGRTAPPDLSSAASKDPMAEVTVKALGVVRLPEAVEQALVEWRQAGGGLEQFSALLDRCAPLAVKPSPVSYLTTAIRNELQERPPAHWTAPEAPPPAQEPTPKKRSPRRPPRRSQRAPAASVAPTASVMDERDLADVFGGGS